MIIASQPTDLLPPTSFWYKMAHADVLDLRIFDPLHPRGMQRRTVMRGRWASIPVVAGPAGSPISEARIVPSETKAVLAATIVERYRESAHWSHRGPQVLDLIDEAHTELLWEFNLHLILGIRQLLGIETPVSIGRAPAWHGGDGLASVMAAYRATTYLSDVAGRVYVGGDESYTQPGIDIRWSAHRPVTGDSIVSVLMDYDDPMAVVLAEEPRPRTAVRVDGMTA